MILVAVPANGNHVGNEQEALHASHLHYECKHINSVT